MRIKEVCFFVLLFFFVSSAYATVDKWPNVSIVPISAYESNEIEYELEVNNYKKSNKVIKEVSIILNGLDIINATDNEGWEEFFNSSYIKWYDGSIANNAYEYFVFAAKAGLVEDDINLSLYTTLVTTLNKQKIYELKIIILNDNTTPILTNNIPQDNSFLRQGMTDQLISIYGIDNETGIKNITFSYWNCSFNATNITVNSIELNEINSSYLGQVDLSEFVEGDVMCFEFKAYNNALNYSIVNGTLGFDDTPPSIELIEPEDGAYGSSSTLFSFNATDNLAQTLACELKIDNETIASFIVNNSVVTNAYYDMSNVSEGNHEWHVECTDHVGLSSASDSKNIIIDNTPPSIVLNSPANGTMIGDNIIIDIEVDDNYELNDVNYSSSLNSSELVEGENKIYVNATDKAGNSAEAEFTFIIDRTPPGISLIAPADNEISESHINFVFDVADNFDENLSCTLYLNSNPEAAQEVNVNEVANISLVLPIGDYEWYVECADDAGNLGISQKRAMTITDLTAPDIVIQDIVYVVRSKNYIVNVNATDISGIDKVKIELNGKSLRVVSSNNTYSATIQTDLTYPLGGYNITITANDTFGNTKTTVDEFTLLPNYIIKMKDLTVEPGKEVIISGTVSLDDGGTVPQNYIMLYLPDGPVNAAIENGTFNHSLNATEKGIYTIRAVIVTAEGIEHEGLMTLNIKQEEEKTIEKKDVTKAGSTMYCGDGLCQSFEDFDKCPADCSVNSLAKTYIADLTKNYTKLLSEKDQVEFNFNLEKHSITVSDIKPTYVELVIESEPILVKIFKSETKKVNINNNYSLFISLNDIENNKANLTFKLIEEPIVEFYVEDGLKEVVINDLISKKESPTGAMIMDLEEHSSSWVKDIIFNPLTIILMLIISVSLYIYSYNKNLSKDRMNWEEYFRKRNEFQTLKK